MDKKSNNKPIAKVFKNSKDKPNTDLVKLSDEKVVDLKKTYASVYGKPPIGAKCNDATWLQSKIDEVSTENTQKRDREEYVKETVSKSTKKQKGVNPFELLIKEVTDVLNIRRDKFRLCKIK